MAIALFLAIFARCWFLGTFPNGRWIRSAQMQFWWPKLAYGFIYQDG